MARPRKNSKQKELQGTSRSDRNVEVLEFELITKVPSVPMSWGFKKEGKAAFTEVCRQLISFRSLNVVNVTFVFLYASEIQKYCDAEKELRKKKTRVTILTNAKSGDEKEVRAMLDKMATEYQNNAKQWAIELGLTPASQNRVHTVKVAPKEKTDLEKLLSGE